MKPTKGIGSRQVFRVSCEDETNIYCDPTDCRILVVEQNDETIHFFKSCLVIAAVGGSNCREARKENPRGPNQDEYVLIKGYAIDGKEKIEKTVVVRDSDIDAKKAEIIQIACGCTSAFNCASPFVQAVQIVRNGAGTFDVFVYVGCDSDEVVDQVNVTFEEPFDGPAPDITEVECPFETNLGGGQRLYVFRNLNFDDNDNVVGVTYQVLTDMYNAQGQLVGNQQEFEVDPRSN